MRILTLLVRHGIIQYPTAVDDLVIFFNQQLPSVSWQLVVIDNSLPENYVEKINSNYTLIGGINTQWEFSSWDSGIKFIEKNISNYDFIHLATSAFKMLNSCYLEKINVKLLEIMLHRGAAIGHLDFYEKPIIIYGRQSQAWLRSSFLFISPTELKILGTLVSVTNPDLFFNLKPTPPFQNNAPLSMSYREYLVGWLTGEGTGQKVQWHSRFELSETTFPYFQKKVIAILNEHLLGIRLRVQGCALVDITWLAKQVNGDRSSIGKIPSWSAQIKDRLNFYLMATEGSATLGQYRLSIEKGL